MENKKYNNIKGSAILCTAALIWGLAFVAQSGAADKVPSFIFNALRSFIGAIALTCFWYIVNKKEKTFTNILSANRIVFTAYMFDKEKLFSVLKNNQIYESKQGQNWQLLLPLAHRFKISKIKKILLNYFVIQSSHSHSVGSTKEKLVKRLNGLIDVLQNVLKEMDVLEEYSSYIEEFKFKYLVNTAYTLRDKVLMFENYKKYRKIGKFNLKLFVKYNLIKFGIKK